MQVLDLPKPFKRGQRKTQDPCTGCSLHRERCICAFIPRLELRARVSLIIHAKELRRTTNTGTLAIKALANSEMRIRGREQQDPLELSDLLSGDYRPLLLYPSLDAVELTREFANQCSRPIHLIVPDGNWRQASKVHIRHSELAKVPRVKMSAPNTELQHLRAESTAHGMATLQAIAHALGIIEGEFAKSELLKLYQLKLERTLQGRGQIRGQERDDILF